MAESTGTSRRLLDLNFNLKACCPSQRFLSRHDAQGQAIMHGQDFHCVSQRHTRVRLSLRLMSCPPSRFYTPPTSTQLSVCVQLRSKQFGTLLHVLEILQEALSEGLSVGHASVAGDAAVPAVLGCFCNNKHQAAQSWQECCLVTIAM